MAKIALCCIATNNYIDFAIPMLESADNFFLIGHDVDYHVFANWGQCNPVNGIFDRTIFLHNIEHQPWPMMTLKRYHIMSAVDLSGYDYCYYIDSDMLFVAPVGDEIFGDLVGVLHPGFYRGGGSWEDNVRSKAYVEPVYRLKYLAGGFQGGSRYYKFCGYLKEDIDLDTQIGVTAVWHDESHWNSVYAYVSEHFTILDPSYCMVQETEKRKAWGIGHFEPKIIALAKDHKKYQK